MRFSRLLATTLLGFSLAACGSLTRSDTQPWLEQRMGTTEHHIAGQWSTGGSWGGNWGDANLIQDGSRFYGQLGSYTVDGTLNGNAMYMVLSAGKKVYYTAALKRDQDGNYAGKVAQGSIIDHNGAQAEGYQVMILRRAEPRKR